MKRWNLTKKQTALYALLPACGLLILACGIWLIALGGFVRNISFPVYVFFLVLAFLFAALALAGAVLFIIKFPKCAAQVVAIVLCAISLIPCTMQITLQIIFWYNAMPHRTVEQVEKIAYKDFNLDEIYFITQQAGMGPWGWEYYLLGERDDEEVFLCIGSRQGPYTKMETEWILSHSFSDVVKKLNSTNAGIICTKQDYSRFRVTYDMEELMAIFPEGNYNIRYKFDGRGLFLVYTFAGNDLFIAEINGELHIYGEGFEAF